MGKKSYILGKKPSNTARIRRNAASNEPDAEASSEIPDLRPNISSNVKNRLKRSEVYGKYLDAKKKHKKAKRLKRDREAGELGAAAPEKKVPRTLENTREVDKTVVLPDDGEVAADEDGDEFARYFDGQVKPKILVTTRPCPSAEIFKFIGDLLQLIPHAYFYPRRSFDIKDICKYGKNKEFTHLIILSEKSKVCNGMIISHLGGMGTKKVKDNTDQDHDMDQDQDHDDEEIEEGLPGPTAFFKVSNVIPGSDVPGHGTSTSHVPELVLNNFVTRLGHRAGRFLGSLFPHDEPQFEGRQVATFHNQRDYIFVRHHRYMFAAGKEEDKETGKKKTRARLQELGPRFTLKMRWLQEGVFDTKFGEYEWIHKRKEMDTTRRRFHL